MSTGQHPNVTHLPGASETGSGRIDTVRPRHHDESRNYGHAAGQLVGVALGSRVDAESRATIERTVADVIDVAIERVEKAERDRAEAASDAAPRALPWAVAGGVITTAALVAIVFALAWLWNIEGRTDAAEEYQRGLAAYLVQKADADSKAHEGIDKILRKMAEAQGVDVRDIEKPAIIEPPNAVRRRALEAASP